MRNRLASHARSTRVRDVYVSVEQITAQPAAAQRWLLGSGRATERKKVKVEHSVKVGRKMKLHSRSLNREKSKGGGRRKKEGSAADQHSEMFLHSHAYSCSPGSTSKKIVEPISQEKKEREREGEQTNFVS